jgi:hypothetical protein
MQSLQVYIHVGTPLSCFKSPTTATATLHAGNMQQASNNKSCYESCYVTVLGCSTRSALSASHPLSTQKRN